MCPSFSFVIFASLLSTRMTLWPISARQVPDTRPTYPAPINARLWCCDMRYLYIHMLYFVHVVSFVVFFAYQNRIKAPVRILDYILIRVFPYYYIRADILVSARVSVMVYWRVLRVALPPLYPPASVWWEICSSIWPGSLSCCFSAVLCFIYSHACCNSAGSHARVGGDSILNAPQDLLLARISRHDGRIWGWKE